MHELQELRQPEGLGQEGGGGQVRQVADALALISTTGTPRARGSSCIASSTPGPFITGIM